MPKEKTSPGPETVQLSAVCITWAIPIYLNTQTWHVGFHNLIMNNYFGIVQPVLHHNPQQYYLSVSTFMALSNRLRPSTIYLLLGSRFSQRTFENLTPRCSKSKVFKVERNSSITRCKVDRHDGR